MHHLDRVGHVSRVPQKPSGHPIPTCEQNGCNHDVNPGHLFGRRKPCIFVHPLQERVNHLLRQGFPHPFEKHLKGEGIGEGQHPTHNSKDDCHDHQISRVKLHQRGSSPLPACLQPFRPLILFGLRFQQRLHPFRSIVEASAPHGFDLQLLRDGLDLAKVCADLWGVERFSTALWVACERSSCWTGDRTG